MSIDVYQILVYQPGGAGGQNLYTSWPALYSALSSLPGNKIVRIDDSIVSPAVMPAGTYDIDGVQFEGIASYTNANGGAILQLAEGVVLLGGMLAIGAWLCVQSVATATAPVTVASGEECNVVMAPFSEIKSLGGQPFFDAKSGCYLWLALAQSTLGDGAHAVLNMEVGSGVQINLKEAAILPSFITGAGDGSLDVFADAETQLPTMPGTLTVNATTVNVAKSFGVDISGTTDAGPDLYPALADLATSAQTARLPNGTIKIGTKGNWPSFSKSELTSSTFINQQLTAGVGPIFSNSFVYATYVARAVAPGTLSATPTYFQATQTISAAIATKPLVGDYLFIQATGGSNGGLATYKILAVAGVASPWTVTLDRPMVWQFVAGDALIELTSVPRDIDIEGNRATASGTGDALVEFAHARGCAVRGLDYNTSTGCVTSGGDVLCFDLGGVLNTMEDCNVDLTGGSVAVGYGVQMQSNERTVYRRINVIALPTGAAAGILLNDNYSSGAEDCWVEGGNATSAGVQVDTLNANTPGNIDVWVRGGGAIATGVGMLIQGGSTGTTVKDWSAIGCATLGVSVSTCSKTSLNGVSATYCGTSGITLQPTAAGVQIKDCDVSHASGGAAHTAAGALDVQSTSFVGIDGLTCDLAANEAAFTVYLHPGSIVAATRVRINPYTYGFWQAGGNLQLSKSNITVSTVGGAGFGPCIYQTAGTTHLEGVTGVSAGAGGYGIYFDGGTLHIGPGCSFDGCTVPLAIVAGTITMDQTGGVAAVTTTAPLTFAQHYNTSVELAAGSAASIITTYAIPGMQWTARNLSGNNLTMKTTTAATVVIAAGKTAIVAVDIAGDMVRVTADT